MGLGAEFAAVGKLVTFGILPTTPETGYGYIRRGALYAEGVYQVARFVEKPNATLAAEYLAGGDYLWNAGIFAMKASVWLAKIRQLRPDIAEAWQRSYDARCQDHDFLRPEAAAFAACPSDSIDYAVMEPLAAEGANLGEVVVVPLDARWSDVGAWSAGSYLGEDDIVRFEDIYGRQG